MSRSVRPRGEPPPGDDPLAALNWSDLSRPPVVIFDGPPLAGTSHSMAVAVLRHFGNPTWINPDVTDLANIAATASTEQLRTGATLAVWLDDLTPADLVLLAGVLDAELAHAAVFVSIGSAWCGRILADRSPITSAARTVLLEYAVRVTLPFALSSDERRRAAQRHPELGIRDSIAEAMVGGDVLVRRYHAGQREHPNGAALVHTAVDVRRCGVNRGLTTTELARLDRRHAPDRSDGEFAEALTWATTRPVDAAEGLLVRGHDEGTWTALSYLAGADDGDHEYPSRGITDHAWAAVLDVLPARDAYQIAVAAHLRHRSDITVLALRRATTSQHPQIAAAALAALRHVR